MDQSIERTVTIKMVRNRCHWYRTELGDVGVGVFRKLMTSLVDSTMLYGSEIWGCNRELEKIEQVQMKALRLFFDPGKSFTFS